MTEIPQFFYPWHMPYLHIYSDYSMFTPVLMASIECDVRGWLVNKLSCCLSCMYAVDNVDFVGHFIPDHCHVRLTDCVTVHSLWQLLSTIWSTQDLLYLSHMWHGNIMSNQLMEKKKSKCWTWNESSIVTKASKNGRNYKSVVAYKKTESTINVLSVIFHNFLIMQRFVLLCRFMARHPNQGQPTPFSFLFVNYSIFCKISNPLF